MLLMIGLGGIFTVAEASGHNSIAKISANCICLALICGIPYSFRGYHGASVYSLSVNLGASVYSFRVYV